MKTIDIQAVLTIGVGTDEKRPEGFDTWDITITHTIKDVEKIYCISFEKTSDTPDEEKEIIPCRAALANKVAVALGIEDDLTQDVNVIVMTDIPGIELKNEKVPRLVSGE